MTSQPARAVIIGGGIIGTSVAYHLAQLGWRDVVLLEQGSLSGGTTWHAAGLVGQLRSSANFTRLIRYSAELYERLEAETGKATGFKRCGSLSVARTAERMTQLRRNASLARSFGIEAHVIGLDEAKRRYPVAAHRRSRGRGVDSLRRQGQSRRHHPGARHRRPRRRRPNPREGAR